MKLNELLFLESTDEFKYPTTDIQVQKAMHYLGLRVDQDYEINEDKSVSLIAANNILRSSSIKRLPVRIHECYGSLQIICESLETLIGLPDKIDDSFFITACNSLISLEHCPRHVGVDVLIQNCNKLTSLNGITQKIDGIFTVDSCNAIADLHGCPPDIGAGCEIMCCDNLISLAGMPEASDYTIFNCKKLTSLVGCPEEVNGGFQVIDCTNLEKLDGVPAVIDYEFKWAGNGALSLVGIADHIKSCKIIAVDEKEISVGGIGLLLIAGLKTITAKHNKHRFGDPTKKQFEIIQKYLGRPDDIFECQAELIEAGYADYAIL